MEPIPDTGGGISGFLAWLLWHVYVYFPFSGTWDWLVLIVVLALVTRLLAVAPAWRLGKWATNQQNLLPNMVFPLSNVFTQTGVMFFLVWFFNTGAGRTFITEQGWFGSSSPLWLLWFSGVTLCLVIPVFLDIVGKLASAEPTIEDVPSAFVTSSIGHAVAVIGAHLFYWYWSVGALALMWVFTLVDMVVVIGLCCWIGMREEMRT